MFRIHLCGPGLRISLGEQLVIRAGPGVRSSLADGLEGV